MKLLNLYASNFKKLNFKKPLSFPDGVVLITGLNESGKSTILDAILYALYGRMIRPSPNPTSLEIINYGASEAQVRLEFAIGEKKYRVVRDIHKTAANGALLYEFGSDGALRTLATTVEDTTREIERLLAGITYNEIVASSMVAQKDLERLVRQRLDDRLKVVNVFQNLDSFNRILDHLNEERTRIEGPAGEAGQLSVERQHLDLLKEKLNEYKEKENLLSGLIERVTQLTSQFSEAQKEFAYADLLHKTLKEYDSTAKLQESLKREMDSKTLLKNSLEKQLAVISSRRAELEEVQREFEAFEKLQTVEQELTKASGLLDQLRGYELQLNKLREQEKRLVAEVAQREKTVQATPQPPKRQLVEIKAVWAYLAAIGALGAGMVISVFLSSALLAGLLGALAIGSGLLLAQQITSLSHEAKAAAGTQESLAARQLLDLRKKDLEAAQKSIASVVEETRLTNDGVILLLRKVPRYSAAASIENNPMAALAEISSLSEKDRQMQFVLKERASLLQKQLEGELELTEQIKKIDEDIQQVKKKLEENPLPELPEGLDFSTESLSTVAGRRDSLHETVSRARAQIEDALEPQPRLRSFLQENSGIEGLVDAQEKKVSILANEMQVLKYSIRGLEQTSETLKNRVKPQVERYMGVILPVITSGRYKAVKLDDDYTVSVFDPEAGEFQPKEVFSGGTEDQLLLAMRLAFALALMPQAKAHGPEFMFLDEPLGSSDPMRREGILALLRKELSQTFNQIFLISHVGDLEAGVDAVIHLEDGTVREVVDRKAPLVEPIPLVA